MSEPEVPFVTPALLEDGCAIIHSILIRKMHGERFIPAHTLYVISYYAPDPNVILAEREAAWAATYKSEATWRVCDYWEMASDIHWDLSGWVEAGKLYWLDADEEVRSDVEGFPYGNINGLRHGYRFSLATGEFETVHTPHITPKVTSDEDKHAINWATLYHAYGPADDIPHALQALTSRDADVRAKARHNLLNKFVHQGSRFEASAYAVEHLCGLVKRRHTLDRADTLYVLLRIALGDHWLDDDTLPYPAERFASVQGLAASDYHHITAKLHDEDAAITEAEQAVLEQLALIWERDAYTALRDRAELLLPLTTRDGLLGQYALSALPWFPDLYKDAQHMILVNLRSEPPPRYDWRVPSRWRLSRAVLLMMLY